MTLKLMPWNGFQDIKIVTKDGNESAEKRRALIATGSTINRPTWIAVEELKDC